ncbi:MAG: DUF4856 domain-containing protein [Nonlabens sp.]
MTKYLALSITLLILLASCSDDDSIVVTAPRVIAPDTYNFERDGNSSVNFAGQTTRIKMAEELISLLKSPGVSIERLDAMIAHEEGSSNFMDPTLNASNKNVRSKIAASRDFFFTNNTNAQAIKSDFDAYLTGQVDEVFPAWELTASAGSAGQLQEAGGGPVRYINAKGLEYDQAFTKGLIGALMIDQINNHYLSTSILDEGDNRENNTAGITVAGTNYTTMEHKWDEAFGYLYGAEPDASNPALNVDSFLSKYLNRARNDSDFAGIENEIYDAFKLGRAAIVAGNYELRDLQASIIRARLNDIIGIRAVYYLQQAKNSLNTNPAAAFHDLSEGYGFIYSLQFTRDLHDGEPLFNRNEVTGYLDLLMQGHGFWDVTPATLDQLSAQISSRFSFSIAQAGS